MIFCDKLLKVSHISGNQRESLILIQKKNNNNNPAISCTGFVLLHPFNYSLKLWKGTKLLVLYTSSFKTKLTLFIIKVFYFVQASSYIPSVWTTARVGMSWEGLYSPMNKATWYRMMTWMVGKDHKVIILNGVKPNKDQPNH